jgi:nucleoside-diphosphate-sugar epimerase
MIEKNLRELVFLIAPCRFGDQLGFFAETYSRINISCGTDVSTLEPAQMVAKITGYSGRSVIDGTKPDGAPYKLMDLARLHSMGWWAKIALEDCVSETYGWFWKTIKASEATLCRALHQFCSRV